jgi:U5 small nuclear ribonucleoprotein component
VLLEGVDSPIKKTATISDTINDVAIFKPIRYDGNSIVKLAVEPLLPAELPKMLEALRKVAKSYPLISTKVEERYVS